MAHRIRRLQRTLHPHPCLSIVQTKNLSLSEEHRQRSLGQRSETSTLAQLESTGKSYHLPSSGKQRCCYLLFLPHWVDPRGYIQASSRGKNMSLPALGTGLCLLTVQPLPSLTAHLSWIFARDPGERRGQNRGERGHYRYTPGTGKTQRGHRQGRDREIMGGLEPEVDKSRKLEWHQYVCGVPSIPISWPCW